MPPLRLVLLSRLRRKCSLASSACRYSSSSDEPWKWSPPGAMGWGEEGDLTREPSLACVRPRESIGGKPLDSGLRALPSRLVPLLIPRARDDGLDRESGVALRVKRYSGGSRDMISAGSLGVSSERSSLGVAKLIKSSGDIGTGEVGERLGAIIEDPACDGARPRSLEPSRPSLPDRLLSRPRERSSRLEARI